MFEVRKPEEDSGLQTAIDTVYSEMAGVSCDSDEYCKMVDQQVKLYSLKETPKRVSPDTLAIVIGNVIGILAIIGYERAHIATSKALQFVLKSR